MGTMYYDENEYPEMRSALLIGAAYRADPQYTDEQLNALIPKILIFDKNLTTIERNKVRNQLASTYGITI